MVRSPVSLAAAVLAVVAWAAPPAAAQIWTGLITGSWNFGANWSPNALPVSGANTMLAFDTASATAMTQDINSTFQLNNMHFLVGGPAYTLTGGGLQFVNTSGAILPQIGFDTASSVTLGNTLTLGNNLTVVGLGSGALTLSGSVNSANGNLTYAGAGTLTFAGSSDNFGLAVTVNSGTVVLAKTSGSSPAVHAVGGTGLTVAGGTARLGGTGGDQIFDSAHVFITSGSLDSNGASEAFNAMNLQGAGIGGNGALVNNAAGTTSVLTPVGGVLLTGNASVGAASTATLVINGPIAGNFGLIKVGGGTLTLGSGSNTYFGGTIVNGGTLALGTGTAIPSGGSVTVNIGGVFSTSGQGNTAATAVGGVAVAGGIFRVPSGAADYYLNVLAMDFPLSVGGTLDFTGSTNAALHFLNSAGTSISAGFQTSWIGAGTSHIQNDSAIPMTIAVTNKLTSSVRLVNGTQGQGFQITGGGTYAPTNIDNSATFTIDGSVLQVADVTAVGSGPLTLVNGAGILYTGATATLSKSFTLGNGGGGLAATAGANLTLSGNIGQSGAGSGLSVIGDPNQSGQGSTVTLTGTNTYTGPTQVTFGGVLSIGSISNGGVAGPLGAASNSPDNLVLDGNASLGATGYLGGGGTLRYTGPTASTDRGLTLADIGFLSAVDVASAGTNLTVSGKITGAGSLTKLGPGTLTITNITNNYFFGTFVNAGRLVLGDNDHILPPGGNVTIAAGAELDTGSPQSVAGSNALGTLALNGGAFRNAASIFFLNKITTDSNGGTITGGASAYLLDFLYAGAGITANGNTSITGSAGSFMSSDQPAIAISVAPGVTLTTNVSMANFNLSGGGTMNVTGGAFIQFSYVVSNAKLRIDGLTTSLQTDNLTLDAGTLQYGGPTATLSRTLNLGTGGGTLEVLNAATTLTITGAITGPGPLTKAGPGVLALNTTANLYTGGITVAAGRLDVSNDAQLGLANPTVNALGTLRYTTNATTARTFNLNAGALEVPSGVTLTLNGAAVGGGFLRGAGTFAVTGGTTLSGTSTANSTTVNVTGPAAFANFSNSGVLALAPALSSPPSFANFINQGSGAISVGAATAVNVADFQSYGTLTLNPAVVGSGQFTDLVNTGTSPLSFNGGSRTFIGTAATVGPPGNPNFVAGVDLNGQNAIVAGGLFVNNGFVADSSNNGAGAATVVADFGSLVKGAGFFQNPVITQNGGKFQAGNSPGSAAFGKLVFGPGGVDNYVFAIDDATGTAGPSPNALGHVSGWGLVKSIQQTIGSATTGGDFVWTATSAAKLTVVIDTLINPTTVGTDVPGMMADFDPTRAYSWLAADWAGRYSGPTDSAILNAATNFDASGFVNPVAGTFGWSLDASEQTLSLTYTPTPVPEPGTLALVGLAAAGLAWRRRRLVNRRYLVLPAAVLTLLALVVPPVAAQSTWTGAVSGLWGDANNWSPVGIPGGGPNTVLTFGAAANTAMSVGNGGFSYQLNQMAFSAGGPAYTVGGNPLDFRTNSASVLPSIVMDTDSSVTIGDPLTLTNNLTVTGAGAGALVLNGVISAGGRLTYSGAGTLTLGGGSNTFTGGTVVSAGTLAVGVNGAALPANGVVTVQAGATLDLQLYTNFAANALGNLTLNGGTLRATGATNSDYYTKALTMTGGLIDFTNTPYTWIHLTTAAGITTNSSATTAIWIGGGASRFINDTGSAIPITVAAGAANGIDLDAGMILGTNGVSNPGFIKFGAGTMRLTNLANTANITVQGGNLRVDDMSTNGNGVLGGAVTLAFGGALQYGGPTASTTKSITLNGGFGGIIQVLTAGTNLVLTGTIGDSGAGCPLSVYGPPALSGGSSTLTLMANNPYSGPTVVVSNGILAIPTIANGGAASPIGTSSNSPSNINLGITFSGIGLNTLNRGTLLLTGTNSSYSTDRGVTVNGSYITGGGGALGVQNGDTSLTVHGQITGSGSFIKTGDGILTLTNNNNYTGGTYIEGGTLDLGTVGPVIPVNSNVTVSAGATFQFGAGPSGQAIGTVTLNGGTLRHVIGGVYNLNRLVTGPAGGTVDAGPGGGVALHMTGAGAGATINGNTTWTGGGGTYIVCDSPGPITVAPNVTLTNSVLLANPNPAAAESYRVAGGGTLYMTTLISNAPMSFTVTQNSRLRVDDLTVTASNTSILGSVTSTAVTLDGGALQYSGPTANTAFPFTINAAGGTVEVSNSAITLTMTGTITTNGVLNKAGPGVLILNNLANTYPNGIAVSGGRLDVSDDAQLGGANPTVNPAGTVRYTASATTGRTFNLNGGELEAPAGVTLTLDGAAVNGGFLRGAGTFEVAGGTVLSGATTVSSSTINVTGPASFVNATHGGRLTVAAGPASPTIFDSFTNQGSGSVTVGAASVLRVSDFQSYGLLTLNPAVVGSGLFTELVNAGTSPLYFNGGSRTFIGTAATAGPPDNPNFVAGMDLGGNNAVVAGGLFVNNGFVADSSVGGTATVIADFGALVKGAGFFQNPVVTQNGGKFQAGNSPGSASFGKFVLGPGGVDNYVFAIDDAMGTAGPSPDALGHVSGWGLIKVVGWELPTILPEGSAHPTSGDFTWTATPHAKLTVALETLINPTTVGTDVPGMMADFDPSRFYSWPAVQWSGTYSGPTDAATLNADTAFDTSSFANPIAGTFGWNLNSADHSLSLTYTPTPVPEPGTLALVGLAVAGLAGWHRRERRT